MTTQSVVFHKDRWTLRSARQWLRVHGYHGMDPDYTANTIRFRQLPPSAGAGYYTVPLPGGIVLVEFTMNRRR